MSERPSLMKDPSLEDQEELSQRLSKLIERKEAVLFFHQNLPRIVKYDEPQSCRRLLDAIFFLIGIMKENNFLTQEKLDGFPLELLERGATSDCGSQVEEENLSEELENGSLFPNDCGVISFATEHATCLPHFHRLLDEFDAEDHHEYNERCKDVPLQLRRLEDVLKVESKLQAPFDLIESPTEKTSIQIRIEQHCMLRLDLILENLLWIYVDGVVVPEGILQEADDENTRLLLRRHCIEVLIFSGLGREDSTWLPNQMSHLLFDEERRHEMSCTLLTYLHMMSREEVAEHFEGHDMLSEEQKLDLILKWISESPSLANQLRNLLGNNRDLCIFDTIDT